MPGLKRTGTGDSISFLDYIQATETSRRNTGKNSNKQSHGQLPIERPIHHTNTSSMIRAQSQDLIDVREERLLGEIDTSQVQI